MSMFVKFEKAERCRRLLGAPASRTVYGVSSAALVMAAVMALSIGVAHATEQLEPEPAAAAPQPQPQPQSQSGAAAGAVKERATVGGRGFSGKAGYYARQLHGHPTASGQSYDHGKMTCAHKTLPFGTKLQVVSRKNKRQVEVVVNDRGPHTPGMVLDLSGEAARQLGMVGDGLHHVDCYIVKPELARGGSVGPDM